jgi:hypothetical protein
MKRDQSTRIHEFGNWSFLIGAEFEEFNNGDSIQVVNGTRVVHISSLRIGSAEKPASMAQIRAIVAKRFGTGEHLTYISDSLQGDAFINIKGDTWLLQGTMCADGTVATCIINFQGPEDRSWAIDVWKSLHYVGEAV